MEADTGHPWIASTVARILYPVVAQQDRQPRPRRVQLRRRGTGCARLTASSNVTESVRRHAEVALSDAVAGGGDDLGILMASWPRAWPGFNQGISRLAGARYMAH